MKFNWKSLVLAIMITGCTSGYCGKESVTCRESGTSFAKEAVMPLIESGEIPGIINVFSKDDFEEEMMLVKQLPEAINITQRFIANVTNAKTKENALKVLEALEFAQKLQMPMEFIF